MKRTLILSFAFLFCLIPVIGQMQYPADSIPASLRLRASAVIRNSQTRVMIINEKQAVATYKKAITLLNDDAEALTIVQIPYDKLRKVHNIKASAYNAAGKLIWTLKPLNIYDFKDFSGPEMLDDRRQKAFEFPTFSFPFTIEYSYEMSMEDLFLSPVFSIQPYPEVSVERSGIQFIIPEAIGFGFMGQNLKSPTDSVKKGNKIYLSWLEENIPAKKQRPFAPDLYKSSPMVYFTPLKTDLKGFKGSFSSWHDYGLWMADLIKGRDELESVYAEQARKLVKDIPDKQGKIKALYEYMQKNTRYYSISFGIGGKQPIPANEVARNGYGDCKALSNYMKALLKAVGIESHYTLVLAGDNEDIKADFACNQFNHAILCVPDKNDTIWLECTDQTSPFNYLGSFTCNRHALAITDNGGILLKTPLYGKDYNKVNSISEIILNSAGDAEIKIKLFQSGLRFDELYSISESKEDERKNWLAEKLGYSSFEVLNEQYSFDKSSSIPTGEATYIISLRYLAASSTGRLYLSPSIFSEFSYIANNPADIEINYDYELSDSVKIAIPSGFKIEFIPATSEFASKFGAYSSSITADQGFIYFKRNISLNRSLYPKESFNDFYNFITEIASAEAQMVVLSKIN